MTGFFEWLGRVIMLVLAGMITLSIIGAIASIPSSSVETRLGVGGGDRPQPRQAGEPQEWPKARPSERAPVPEATGPEPQPSPAPPPQPGVAPPGTETIVVPAPQPRPTAEQWLEAITYALLALTGLVALGVVLLFRAVQLWRRNTEALEKLARRG